MQDSEDFDSKCCNESKIFVHNLDFDAKNDQILALFSQFGAVMNV
jgi:RNA recognition motif-containing protein